MATEIKDLPAPALLRRVECAKALTGAGFPVSPKTLATMATRGGGPPFHKFGRTVLYRWGEALAWAENRLSAPRRTTRKSVVSIRRSRHDGRAR